MNASVIVLLLFLARLVVPIVLLLVVGEWISRHEPSSWLRM